MSNLNQERKSHFTSWENSELWAPKVSRFLCWLIPSYGANASLAESWNYFENIVLPRRLPCGKISPPGMKPSKLYSAWSTPIRELKDFGTGIAVYFETLWYLFLMLLTASVLYIPSIIYYNSNEYDDSRRNDVSDGVLRGSLVCTDMKFVPCPNCTMNDPEREEVPNEIGFVDSLVFVMKNKCSPLRWQEGMNHVAVVIFIIFGIVYLNFKQKKMELEFDESMLTASDYSIIVDNPPRDAKDAKEWKIFFEQFGEVVYCTVALDNEQLVKSLVKRREILQEEYSDSELNKINTVCSELLEKEYNASAIFITFNKEKTQREVLKSLSFGKLAVSKYNLKHLFRGNFVLNVKEAKEPSAIRWEDLDASKLKRLTQCIFTSIITILIIILGYHLVKRAFNYDVNLGAYTIAVQNIIVPQILKLIQKFEEHPYKDTYEASLFAKITLFRWVNTAIVTTAIKPFTETLSADEKGLIPAIYAILKAEIITAPLLHICDIVGQIKRFVLAPRAKKQSAMNTYFHGSKQNLGEKYTNMTKIVFLCCFYSVIFPASFMFGALAILATYVTDKFCLFRSWGRLPELGNDVAKLSRGIFFPLVLFVLVALSQFYWSTYPFDNLCESDIYLSNETYPDYIGTHIITTAASESAQITMKPGQKVYRFCQQDYIENPEAIFKFSDWMSNDQIAFHYLFSFLGMGLIITLAFITIVYDIRPRIKYAVKGDYTTIERDSGETYTSQPHIKAYIPQVSNKNFLYPLILSDITNIDSNHIGWTDPTHNHFYYDVSNDVIFLHSNVKKSSVLSSVTYWRPKETTNYGSLSQSS